MNNPSQSGVPVTATLYHCDKTWMTAGRLDNGFFFPDDKSAWTCPSCGQKTRSYSVENAPLPT